MQCSLFDQVKGCQLQFSMQVRHLSERGIQKLVKGETGVVLQIMPYNQPTDNNQKLLRVPASDGFAYIDIYILKEARDRLQHYRHSNFSNFVVRISRLKNLTANIARPPYIIVYEIEVLDSEVQTIVGSPIPYDQYQRKGNKNGHNSIPKDTTRASSSKRQSRQEKSNSVEKKSPHQKQNWSEGKVATKSVQSINRRLSPQRAQRLGTPDFVPISDLMVDAQGWTLLGRVINKNEPRSFIGKRGAGQIMTIQIVDKSGSIIEGIFFGDMVSKYSGMLEINEVYQISGGNVEHQRDQGGKPGNPIQIVFGDKSVFKVHSGRQRNSIPHLEDLAIKLNQLTSKLPNPNQSWDVIALVKEQKKLEHIKTKTGKDMPKKVIVICDPDEKLQVPITLFFRPAEQEFDGSAYYFRGISVGEYQGSKQLSMSFKSNIIPLHDFRFKSRKDIEDIDFHNGIQQLGNRPHQSSNILHLIQDQQKLTQTSSVWHDVRCYINAVKAGSSPWYIGCPSCKRKVRSDDSSKCNKCGQIYSQPKYYYVLNIEVMDADTSIWVTAYDDVAQVLLDGLKAEEANDMGADSFRECAKSIRTKQIRAVISSRGETYEGVWRVRRSVSRLIPIDYASEARDLLFLIKANGYE